MRTFWKIQVPKSFRNFWSRVWRMRLQYFTSSPNNTVFSQTNWHERYLLIVFLPPKSTNPAHLMTSLITFSSDTIWNIYKWRSTQCQLVFCGPVCVVRMGFSALVCACVVVLCSGAPFNLPQRNEPQNDRPIIGKPLTLILYVKQMCALSFWRKIRFTLNSSFANRLNLFLSCLITTNTR